MQPSTSSSATKKKKSHAQRKQPSSRFTPSELADTHIAVYSQAPFAAELIAKSVIDTIVDNGAQLLYDHYINSKVPNHIADSMLTIFNELISVEFNRCDVRFNDHSELKEETLLKTDYDTRSNYVINVDKKQIFIDENQSTQEDVTVVEEEKTIKTTGIVRSRLKREPIVEELTKAQKQKLLDDMLIPLVPADLNEAEQQLFNEETRLRKTYFMQIKANKKQKELNATQAIEDQKKETARLRKIKEMELKAFAYDYDGKPLQLNQRKKKVSALNNQSVVCNVPYEITDVNRMNERSSADARASKNTLLVKFLESEPIASRGASTEKRTIQQRSLSKTLAASAFPASSIATSISTNVQFLDQQTSFKQPTINSNRDSQLTYPQQQMQNPSSSANQTSRTPATTVVSALASTTLRRQTTSVATGQPNEILSRTAIDEQLRRKIGNIPVEAAIEVPLHQRLIKGGSGFKITNSQRSTISAAVNAANSVTGSNVTRRKFNDLTDEEYNNGNLRQTTTMPYMQIKEGVVFTEIQRDGSSATKAGAPHGSERKRAVSNQLSKQEYLKLIDGAKFVHLDTVVSHNNKATEQATLDKQKQQQELVIQRVESQIELESKVNQPKNANEQPKEIKESKKQRRISNLAAGENSVAAPKNGIEQSHHGIKSNNSSGNQSVLGAGLSAIIRDPGETSEHQSSSNNNNNNSNKLNSSTNNSKRKGSNTIAVVARPAEAVVSSTAATSALQNIVKHVQQSENSYGGKEQLASTLNPVHYKNYIPSNHLINVKQRSVTSYIGMNSQPSQQSPRKLEHSDSQQLHMKDQSQQQRVLPIIPSAVSFAADTVRTRNSSVINEKEKSRGGHLQSGSALSQAKQAIRMRSKSYHNTNAAAAEEEEILVSTKKTPFTHDSQLQNYPYNHTRNVVATMPSRNNSSNQKKQYSSKNWSPRRKTTPLKTHEFRDKDGNPITNSNNESILQQLLITH